MFYTCCRASADRHNAQRHDASSRIFAGFNAQGSSSGGPERALHLLCGATIDGHNAESDIALQGHIAASAAPVASDIQRPALAPRII
eukprot:1653062-Prymnesium_polylepis.4